MIDEVKYLVDIGFAVHILHPQAKNPVETKWASADVYSYKELEAKYRSGQNVGARLGKPSRIGDSYLHAIDLDIRDENLRQVAVDKLREMFGAHGLNRMWCVKSGSGGSSRHYYFLSDAAFPTQNLAKSDEFVVIDGRKRRSWEIDLLGTGKQVVLPPSIHPETKKPYKWLIDPDVDYAVEVDSDYLTDLIEPDHDYSADRNDEPMGIDFDEARDILKTVADMANDHPTWVRVGMALKHEFGDDGWPLFDEWSKNGRGYDRRDNLYQWKRFTLDRREIITMRSVAAEAREVELGDMIDDLDDEETVMAEVKQVEKSTKKAKERVKGDPDMRILSESTMSAPPMPLSILGPKVSALTKKAAAAMSAPVDFLAAALLAGVSTAIGNAVEVEIKSGYRQPAAIWCMVVGGPSSKKSPPLRLVTKTLAKLESMYEPLYKAAMADWERKKSLADMKRKEWDGMIKKLIAAGEPTPNEMPDDCLAPPEPTRRRIILNDVTIEAFMRTQARSPRGFMLYRDELTGWLKSMDRYSSGSGERGAWLESYDAGPFSMDRVKDDGKAVKVDKVYSPILGGIQPERLMEITGLDQADDGLQARFLTFWPDANFIEMHEEEGDDGAWLAPIYENLLAIELKEVNGTATPAVIPFSKEARQAFIKWSNEHNRAEQNVETRLRGVFGKADGQVGRLALILELLWWAAASDDFDPLPLPKTVSLKAFKAAMQFREEYIKPMQRRVYSKSIEIEEVTNARRIAQWITQNDISTFNARTMRREAGIGGISARTAPEIVDDALALLVSNRWLTVEEIGARGRGRPTKTYTVNERIWDLLEKEK